MFKLVSWGHQRFDLHPIRGALLVANGGYLARAEAFALTPMSHNIVRASLIDGVSGIQAFVRIIGRYPDDVWAELVLPPSITAVATKPEPSVARWDEQRALWVEEPDLAHVMPFGRSVVALEKEDLRWADGRTDPLPTLPSDAGEQINPKPGFGPFVAGAHSFYTTRRNVGEPWRWWHFEPSSLEATELSLPLKLGEHAGFAARGVEPLYVCTASRSAPFVARWVAGQWDLLPQPPDGAWPVSMTVTHDGSLWVVARQGDAFDPFEGLLLRYREGFGWQHVRLPAPSAGAVAERIDITSGPAGELWLSIEWRGVVDPRCTLHAWS